MLLGEELPRGDPPGEETLFLEHRARIYMGRRCRDGGAAGAEAELRRRKVIHDGIDSKSELTDSKFGKGIVVFFAFFTWSKPIIKHLIFLHGRSTCQAPASPCHATTPCGLEVC
jgi:hypothetical protein